MTSIIKIKRGLDNRRQNYVLQEGELVWTPDLKELWVGDGITSGGRRVTQTIEETFINKTEKAQALGVASLDINGKILPEQLPPIAITEVFVVGSEAEQLALPAQAGDIAVRTDQQLNYIKASSATGTMTDWVQLQVPVDAVQSINNKTGVVSLAFVDLADAKITNIQPQELIQWDGTQWVNIPADSVGRTTLDALDDTSISTLNDGDTLVYDSVIGLWKNAPAVSTFIDAPDTPLTYAANAGNLVVVNAAETAVEFTAVVDAGLYNGILEPEPVIEPPLRF